MNETATQDLLAQDSAHREQAIHPERSFLIEAPAGAGKTELLTQRFLALLARVREPEEIVALTFTNKAAAEMRDRVLQSLQMAAAGQVPETEHKRTTYELGCKALAQDRQQRWQLLEHPGRLQILTLDALCGKLARQMPLLSRLGSQPGVALDPQPHYEQAARDTLQWLEGTHEAADALERVLAHFDNDVQGLQKQLVGMLAQRDRWMRHAHGGLDLNGAEAALGELIGEELAQAAALLPDDAQRLLMPAARFAASQVLTAQDCGADMRAWQNVAACADWTQPLRGTVDELPQWRALPVLLLTQAGLVRAKLPAELGFGATPQGKALAQAALPVLQALKDSVAAPLLRRLAQLPDPQYSAAECALINDLLVVLKVATAQLWLSFQRAREVDFTEMAQNALLALGRPDAPSDLQLQLDYRISHLLVDEFQDTSPTQVELLQRLIAGWQSGDGRSLFLVGDPMQSIYRFRKADVGLFLQVRERGLGGWPLQSLHLYRNNRSYDSVVNWVNQTFPGVFAPADNHHRGAVRFARATATRGGHPLAQVCWHPQVDEGNAEEDDASGTAQEREARQIIAIIRDCQAQDPQGSIAVLVRARSHLQTLVEQLRTQRPPLPFQAVEIEALAERQVIADLHSLTHALHHLGDRTHWLAILRAPWCGLTLHDLHALAADDHHSSVWALMHEAERIAHLSADGQQRLLHVRTIVAAALPQQGRLRPRRWVEGVWQALGGPLCLQAKADLLDAAAYFDALQRCEHDGSLRLDRLPRELEELYAAPDPLASDRLQLMTIHKAKGLEFDTVILPGLQRKTARTDSPLLLWDEVLDDSGQERLVIAAHPARSASGATAAAAAAAAPPPPPKYGLLHRLESERARNEAQRLLYVAVTRAKRQLHLLGSAKPVRQETNSLRAPAPDSLLALLWHVAEPVFVQHLAAMSAPLPSSAPSPESSPDPGLARSITLADHVHQLLRLAQAQVPAALHRPAHAGLCASASAPEPVTAQGVEPGDADPNPASPSLASDLGTLVHRYLDMIALDGLELWPPERLLRLAPAMQTWLEQRGHAPPQASATAQTALQQLLTTRRSSAGIWLLSPHAQARSEWALTQYGAGQAQSHVLDRSFVADGVRWIVDYKTTRAAAQPAEQYRAQLERYQRLFDATHPVRLAVFYTESGELEVLASAGHPARQVSR